MGRTAAVALAALVACGIAGSQPAHAQACSEWRPAHWTAPEWEPYSGRWTPPRRVPARCIVYEAPPPPPVVVVQPPPAVVQVEPEPVIPEPVIPEPVIVERRPWVPSGY